MKSNAGPRRTRTPAAARSGTDQDNQKGATEENRPGPGRSRHPGLDENGLPNDPVAIAQDREGANADLHGGDERLGVAHIRCADAEADHEHFDGKTTE